jgi:hypothetical protein
MFLTLLYKARPIPKVIEAAINAKPLQIIPAQAAMTLFRFCAADNPSNKPTKAGTATAQISGSRLASKAKPKVIRLITPNVRLINPTNASFQFD